MKAKQRKGYVYTLANKNTGAIFYVGASVFPEGRLNFHIACTRTGITPLYRAIKNMKYWPQMEIIDEVDFFEWNELKKVEYYWIDQLRQWGFKLKNVSGNLSFFKKKYKKPGRKKGDIKYGMSYILFKPEQAMRILNTDKAGVEHFVKHGAVKKIVLSRNVTRYKIINLDNLLTQKQSAK